MKICMTLLNLGSVKHDARVCKEASSLAKAGNSVRLVAMKQQGEELGNSMDGFELSLFTLKTRSFPSNVFTWILKFLEFSIKSIYLMISFKADIYHAHDLNTLIPVWIAARLTGAKIVYDSHELFTERPIETPGLWRFVERRLINRVNAVIAANEHRAEIMYKEYGAKKMPAVIMNCPSSRDHIQKGETTLRETLPETVRNKFILLYQGALSANRCLESLALSAKYLDDQIILVFLGNTSSFSENVIKKIVEENELSEKVFFINSVDSKYLVHFISSADLGVVIYKNSCRNNYLCAPNKLFDYCMAALPSIGCNFPPVQLIADKYKTTKLFDPENPQSIVDAANSFKRNHDEYLIAKNATTKVANEFTWENEEIKLTKLYESIR